MKIMDSVRSALLRSDIANSPGDLGGDLPEEALSVDQLDSAIKQNLFTAGVHLTCAIPIIGPFAAIGAITLGIFPTFGGAFEANDDDRRAVSFTGLSIVSAGMAQSVSVLLGLTGPLGSVANCALAAKDLVDVANLVVTKRKKEAKEG